SLETAARIKELSEGIGIKHLAAVISKGTSADMRPYLEELGIRVLGEIPYSQEFVRADLEGIAPIDLGGNGIQAIEIVKENMLTMIQGFEE
ncbi:MAG: cobalamin biosynthesis protein CobN, partial [Methanosarcinaceae archaeon]|nr:cobalamin biosynthesis protein CobN [Methanosarcinaceae archaeon]